MWLSHLQLHNFRNITEVSLDFKAACSVFIGPNGSGKTSLLEAIYYLGHGRSFRSQILQRIIQYDTSHFVVFGKLSDEDQGQQFIGIEKYADGRSMIKINHDNNGFAAALAKLLPILLIYPGSYQLLDRGPKFRRQILDWGLFHVEQRYYILWQKLQRVLKQRNAGLRSHCQYDVMKVWDEEFLRLALEMDEYRQGYIKKLVPLVVSILAQMVSIPHLSIHYARGWSEKGDLAELLVESLQHDKERGYTFYGPQRADLVFKVGKHPAHEVLSRGQQKLLVIAVRLAQGILLKQDSNRSCVFLLDDIASELDSQRKKLLVQLLRSIDAQVFISSVDEGGLEDIVGLESTQLFHVEQMLKTSRVFHVEHPD